MKNLKNLGSILTKAEQQSILGGNPACRWGPCDSGSNGRKCCIGSTIGKCSNGVCDPL